MELLSPAGSYKSAKAAIKSGADAIYLGVTDIFHQRSRCRNFNDHELQKIVKIAHKSNVKIYVTFNSSYNIENFKSILSKIDCLVEFNIDGLIISDIGLIRLIRQQFIDLKIMFSVQGQCANSDFASLLKNLGVFRVVFDRNISIAEAKAIKEKSGVEVEMFLFGYQCYSQDSICYMGDYFFGEPCNVLCAQKVKFVDDNVFDDIRRYFFMQYMSGLNAIAELVDSGIDSVKIEGRQRSSDYVSRVTKVFREAIDYYKECKEANAEYVVQEQWIKDLKFAAFDFEITDGFFCKGQYRRSILKNPIFKTKLIYLYDCLYNFFETFNFVKLWKEFFSSLKIAFWKPNISKSKSAEKIKSFE